MNEHRDIWQDRCNTLRLSGLRMAQRRDANCCSEGKNDPACRDHVLRRDSRKRTHRSDIWRSWSPHSDRSKTHFRHCPPLLTRSITVHFCERKAQITVFFREAYLHGKTRPGAHTCTVESEVVIRLHFL